MPSLVEQLARVRWLLVPLAAYLAITLALPVANGAARRPDFTRHAALVLGACAVVVAITLAIHALADVVRRRS